LTKVLVSNWNNYPRIEATVLAPVNLEELSSFVQANKTVIARGNGRCYGDSSLSNTIISTLKLNQVIDFNVSTGIINSQSGILLDDLLKLIVPKGYFLPVSPGTKLITLGGAFSSDIHGKNHHVEGSFSNYVLDFDLMLADGCIETFHPHDEMFKMTAGGLGATGIITRIRFKLKKIETSYIQVKALKAKGLKDVIQMMKQTHQTTYSVAWIDCLAKGKSLGKSVLLLGEHITFNSLPEKLKSNPLKLHSNGQLKVPFYFPTWVLSTLNVRIFNWFYYRKSTFSSNSIQHYNNYFYPLDGIGDWNKIYGKNGFIEYQFVLPFETAVEGIEYVLSKISNSRLASFLCVIKLLGKNDCERFLNFPKEGITLGMDLKMSPSLFPLLDELDTYITAMGGRIYLTKDTRLKKEFFLKQYAELIPPSSKFISHQMLRLNQSNSTVLLVLGANSDIAKSYILLYAKRNPSAHLLLASRDLTSLQSFLKVHKLSNPVDLLSFDAEELDSHEDFVRTLPLLPSEILYAAGYCPTNEKCFADNQLWVKNTMVNYVGAVSVLNHLVQQNNPFLKRVVGISSIAGMRGRKSNFLYGSSKSAFHHYLEGLRQELWGRSIVVQSLTPGAVRTKMTAHLSLPFFASNPNDLANKILANKKTFQLYPNLLWKTIALIVKLAPLKIVSKMK
jgi:decaprenylphospho-beta-D-ribofuranose 2-oxidase